MGLSTRKLESAIKDLRTRARGPGWKGEPWVVHQAWTVQPFDVHTAQYLQTHAAGEEGMTWLVPIQLHGILRCRRISTMARESTAETPVYAVGIYKAEIPVLGDKETILGEWTRIRFKRVGASVRSVYGGADDPGQLNFNFSQEVVLDPRVGQFYVGYQSTYAELRWLVPSYSVTNTVNPSLVNGFKTKAAGNVLGEVPEHLVRTGERARAVCFALRSAVGVQLFGDPEEL